MDKLVEDCLHKVKIFQQTMNPKDMKQLNQLIAIYDKVKDIEELLVDYDGPNLLEQKQQELEWEQDLLEMFGPQILLYLLSKSLLNDNKTVEET